MADDGVMNLSRLVFLIVAGGCFLADQPLNAQATAAPFTPDKQYSADEVITTKGGMNIATRVYMDNEKIRSEMTMQGMSMISIMRLDLKKMYSVMPAQRMVMAMPLDPDKIKQKMPGATADDGKFEVVGPDTVDGVPCTKYKMTTTKDNKVFYWWVNVATKAPVKMTSEDGSFTLTWKNYVAGPQDAALFEVPAGYQVMDMPSMPSMPGGMAPGGP
jgi:hypothetical protein